MTAAAALLTLSDARLPTGGHAHSGGVEQAISAGVVTDAATLADFLHRRLHTVGPVAAALAAAACHAVGCQSDVINDAERHPRPTPSGVGLPAGRDGRGGRAEASAQGEVDGPLDGTARRLAELDAEVDARTPSPALRGASRSLGRGLARLGKRAWPHTAWAGLPDSPHHSIALGVAAAAGGVDPHGAAEVAAYLAISGPATAAQRLLSLDPLTVASITAGLCARIDAVADRAWPDPIGPLTAAAGLFAPPARSDMSALSDPWFDLLAENHAARKDRLFAS